MQKKIDVSGNKNVFSRNRRQKKGSTDETHCPDGSIWPDGSDWPDFSDWPDMSDVGKDIGKDWPDMADLGRDIGGQIPPVE